ncbi:hypothetical protein FCOIX_9910 [Fusarium coicis]|nr:hypothetical protein FCOIX_9910 [Fusarium coicis]
MSSQYQDITLEPTGLASLPQGEDFQAEVASVQDPLALDLTDPKKETDGVIPNPLGVVVGLLLPLNCQTPVDINLVGTFDAGTGHVVPYQAGCLLFIRPLLRNNGEFHVLYKNVEHRPLRLSMKLLRTSADLIYYDEWTTFPKGPMKLDFSPEEDHQLLERVNEKKGPRPDGDR